MRIRAALGVFVVLAAVPAVTRAEARLDAGQDGSRESVASTPRGYCLPPDGTVLLVEGYLHEDDIQTGLFARPLPVSALSPGNWILMPASRGALRVFGPGSADQGITKGQRVRIRELRTEADGTLCLIAQAP